MTKLLFKAIGSGTVHFHDKEKLPYTQAAVYEAQRIGSCGGLMLLFLLYYRNVL